MNIALLEPIGISKEEIDALAAPIKKAGHTFTYYDTKTTDPEELSRRSAGQDVVMIANNPYPDAVIKSADKLKMIAVAFTGIDHVGTAACKEKGITVLNCAGYSNISVAEEAIGLTIGLYRKFKAGDTAVHDGKTSAGLTGLEIAGKTVGIVGCGQIGMQTAKLYKAFGARVLAYARHIHADWKDAGIEAANLDTLLEESDIISVHLPNNAHTKGFIGEEEIAKMKDTAILINCARGPVVDTTALADALNTGKLAGAGIDVFDTEPPIPADNPLLSAPNTLLMPHVGFLTHESMQRRAAIEFDNVISWLNGTPKNVCEL